jgi:hypothetical protein
MRRHTKCWAYVMRRSVNGSLVITVSYEREAEIQTKPPGSQVLVKVIALTLCQPRRSTTERG